MTHTYIDAYQSKDLELEGKRILVRKVDYREKCTIIP